MIRPTAFATFLAIAASMSTTAQDGLNRLFDGERPAPPPSRPAAVTPGPDAGGRPFVAPQGGQAMAAWNFSVYIAADNNLDPASMADVQEMEQIGSTPEVKIVVFVDRAKGWRTARRALITRHPEPDVQSLDPSAPGCEELGEVDSGSPETLRQFAEWSLRTHPAQRCAFIVWNHGGGWRDLDPAYQTQGLRAICQDDTSGNKIYNKDLRQALEQTGRRFDLIGMDACLMGMVEVAYEMRQLTPAIVASSQNIPEYGYDYAPILQALTQNPGMDGMALGEVIVRSYANYYGNFQKAVTLSLVDTSRLESLNTELNNMVRALGSSSGPAAAAATASLPPALESAGRQARRIGGNKAHIDLGAFLAELSRSQTAPEIQRSAQRALDAYRSAVRNNFSQPAEAGTGMAIYLPDSAGAQYYNDYTAQNIAFARDSLWPRLIMAYAQGGPLGIPGGETPGGGGLPGDPPRPPAPITPGPPAQPGWSPASGGGPAVRVTHLFLGDTRGATRPIGFIQPGREYWILARSETAGARPGLTETVALSVYDSMDRLIASQLRFRSFDFDNGAFVYAFRFRPPDGAPTYTIVATHYVFDSMRQIVTLDRLGRVFRLGGDGLGQASTRQIDTGGLRGMGPSGTEAQEATKSIARDPVAVPQSPGGWGPAAITPPPRTPAGARPTPPAQPGGASALDNLFQRK